MTKSLSRRDTSEQAELSPESRLAVDLLSKVLAEPVIAETLGDLATQARMIYTRALTIWMLILQRLGKGMTLNEVVCHLLRFDHGLLGDNKRVREGTLSNNNSAYSAARQELPLERVLVFSRAVCDYLAQTSEPIFEDRRIFILDGTTFTLPPTPELRSAFPPASNQHGESVWPIALLAVAHELRSGCALLPQIDPMYGPNKSSETKQCLKIIEDLPENSIVMADSNFGIFGVAYACRQAGHNFLFRLTTQRFKSLVKQATLHSQEEQCKTYMLSWRPSPQDRRSTPELPNGTRLECYLHEFTMPDGQPLYLVTDLKISGPCAAELYRLRYNVEFDIRDVKVTLHTESIRAKSVAMFMKEIMSSIVGFNLMAQFRRQAAKLAQVEPRKLSFTDVWRTFRYELLYANATTPEQWQEQYTRALISASRCLLPNRKKPRSSPRKAHPRRSKTTKFQKAQRASKASKPPPVAPK